MTSGRRDQAAGCDALPLSFARRRASRGAVIAVLAVLVLAGCGAKPQPPTAPIRTHLEEAAMLLPSLPPPRPWRRFTFNDWEQLRARAGLGEAPVAEWDTAAHRAAANTLRGWLVLPSTVESAAALAPLGTDGATIRWQAGLSGSDDQPITRLITMPARDDRATRVRATLASAGYPPVSGSAATAAPDHPLVCARAPGTAGTLPALLDSDAAALLVTPTAYLSVHDAARVPDALAALGPNGPDLDSEPIFHGLVAGISEVEALIVFHTGADGYRDATAPALVSPTLPFDAVGAALHITDAGAQYVTLAFHLRALPGGRLPDGMAEWWASRFGLDQPDPRVEYLEAFGNDGWLFARYRALSPDERKGGAPPGEVPFWRGVTTWQTVHQRWSAFSPRDADPIPRLGS